MTNAIRITPEMLSKPTPTPAYVLDDITNRGFLSDRAYLLGLAVGKWVVMRKQGYRTATNEFHAPQLLISIYANGDFRTNYNERIGSGSGHYKGASSKRHSGDWLCKVFSDEESAYEWIRTELANAEEREARQKAERDAKFAERDARINEHNAKVAEANPGWVESLLTDEGLPNERWMALPTGEYCLMAPITKPDSDTTAVLALIAKRVVLRAWDLMDYMELRESNLDREAELQGWELSVGHYSSRNGGGMGSMSAPGRKTELAPMLLSTLRDACQYN